MRGVWLAAEGACQGCLADQQAASAEPSRFFEIPSMLQLQQAVIRWRGAGAGRASGVTFVQVDFFEKEELQLWGGVPFTNIGQKFMAHKKGAHF